MELTGQLLRWAAQRPHLLLAEAPGGTLVRLAVERLARENDWPLALSPADADVLVACGPMTGELADALEVTWRAMSAPRARVAPAGAEEVAAALTAAVHHLADVDAQRRDAAGRDRAPQHDAAASGDGMNGMDMPGGLMMADRAPDRDGLKLDVLHLRLGPFLPAWPAGLAVDISVQGDVVQSAEALVLGDGAHDRTHDGPHEVWPHDANAARLDSAARLLQLAGWSSAAWTARDLRDRVLGGTSLPPSEVERLAARVRRSRSLRSALRDLGTVSADDERRSGIPAGDVHARLLRWLDDAIAGASRSDVDRAAVLAALPALLVGQELAGARLIVASVEPELTWATQPVGTLSGAGRG